MPGCGTWHSSILWPFSLCPSLGIQSFVFCHINNSLLLFAPLPAHVMPRQYIPDLSVCLSLCTPISIYLPSLFDIYNFQLVKVPAYAHLFWRSLSLINNNKQLEGECFQFVGMLHAPSATLSLCPVSPFRALKLIILQIINMNSRIPQMMPRVILMGQVECFV